MSSIISWIKREIIYIRESFLEIFKAFFLFILISSGLVSAIFLRYLGYSGTVITFFSILIEFIALILCFLLLKNYLEIKESSQTSKIKEKTN